MPELPEVESVARALRSSLTGRRATGLVVRWAGILEPTPRAVRRASVGRVLSGVHRRGKYLVLTFTGGDGAVGHVMLHLRMSGQLLFEPDDAPDKHTHLIWDFEGRPLHYRDVRKFGRWTVVDDAVNPTAMAHVGPDMLEVRFAEWNKRVAHRKAPWKSVLLDQGVASGIGNIYADEALFRAGVHPLKTPEGTSPEKRRAVWNAAKGVLRLAVKHGGTTFLDFKDFHGKPGNFRRKLRVFQRDGEACGRCGVVIQRVVVGGRSTHYCPACQP